MDDSLLAPYGLYCGTCEFLNREEMPNCSGCGNQEAHPFWGECKLYACAKERKTEHCGLCEDFPCELFVNQFDPAHGQKSAFTRARLLAYRKKAGTEKYVKMVRKLEARSQEFRRLKQTMNALSLRIPPYLRPFPNLPSLWS